jgi:cytochrome P450
MTLFVAGHETTAQALSWAWYLLARNPAVMDRLRREGQSYALLAIKEAMRIYPPAYAIARSTLRATKIGDFSLEADEMVVIAPWLLHRNPRYFPKPLEFRPERFLEEGQWPRFAYIPFGGGRRICIGNQFALMEAQIVLTTIASALDIELVSPREPVAEPLLTLRPKGGIQVRIRHSNFLAPAGVITQGAGI